MVEILTAKSAIRRCTLVFSAALLAVAGWSSLPAAAQDAAPKPVTFLGTVQTMSGSTLTVKSDAGATMQVTVGESAKLLRIEPGQKSLAGASPFNLVDLQAGDRVMARGAANSDGKELAATMLVAIKSADIEQKHQQEREDWQKNGTGGLVKSVDTAASTVTIAIGLAGGRTEVVHVQPTTIVRRYAPGSVKFDQAVKGTLDQIKSGDQLRARGKKGADGSSLEAEEIVSGSFRNFAGAVTAIDGAASTITVTDSTTKKSVVITITPDSEVKKLDSEVAQRLAARMSGKRPDGSPASGSPRGPGSSAPPPDATAAGGPKAGAVPKSGAGPDFQQLLARAPSINLKDLAKGNMVIAVATEGQTPDTATAITVVAGVEPMLQASTSGSQAMLSSSWNLGGGGGEGGGGEGQQ
jgi:hypothetical protein